MRKKAQERKRKQSPSSSSSLSSSSSSSCFSQSQDDPLVGSLCEFDQIGKSLVMSGDRGSCASLAVQGEEGEEESAKGYTMEQIWKEIDLSSEKIEGAIDISYKEGCNFSCPSMPSPVWDYHYDLSWKMDEEELKIWPPMGEFCCSNHQQGRES